MKGDSYMRLRYFYLGFLYLIFIFPASSKAELNKAYLPSIYSLLLDEESVSACHETFLRPWSEADNFPAPFTNTFAWPTVVGDNLYLALDNQLAVTDGSILRTKAIDGQLFSFASIRLLTAVDDKLFFVAGSDSNGDELWVLDNPNTVPRVLTSITEGNITIQDLVSYKNKLYFISLGSSDSNVQDEGLWVSDGTALGTMLVKDFDNTRNSGVNDGTFDLRLGQRSMVVYKNTLLFAGSGRQGIEPWVSDGTSDGTQQLIDINTANDTAFPDSEPRRFVVVGDEVYFTANNGIFSDSIPIGEELYTFDGEDVSLVKDIYDGSIGSVPRGGSVKPLASSFFKTYKDYALFNALDSPGNVQLWLSNGSEQMTFPLTEFSVIPPNVTNGIQFNGDFYFNANTLAYGDELWVTDGTFAGTHIYKDLIKGDRSSSIESLTSNGDFLFFQAATVASDFSDRQFVAMDDEGNIERFDFIAPQHGIANLNGEMIYVRGESGLWKMSCSTTN